MMIHVRENLRLNPSLIMKAERMENGNLHVTMTSGEVVILVSPESDLDGILRTLDQSG